MIRYRFGRVNSVGSKIQSQSSNSRSNSLMPTCWMQSKNLQHQSMVNPLRSFSESTSRYIPSSFPNAIIPEWSSKEARLAAQGLIHKFYPDADLRSSTSQPATSLVQVLDHNQISLLRTLVDEMVPLLGSKEQTTNESRNQDQSFVLSPSEHLVYFTPTSKTSALGRDGSDTTFNPPGGIFVRRMWAGGKMTWKGNLKVNDQVKEDTFIEEVTVKRMKNGSEMLVVWVRKEYRKWLEDQSSWSKLLLEDKRSWVYQKALSPVTNFFKSEASSPHLDQDSAHDVPRSDLLPACFSTSDISRSTSRSTSLIQSPTHLFRYSALTYNAHSIHLCPIWAKEKEGHKERVVHGPLNLNLIMRQFEKRFGKERKVLEVIYRAKNPVYVGEKYTIRFKKVEEMNHALAEDEKFSDELEIIKVDGEREILVMEAIVVSAAV